MRLEYLLRTSYLEVVSENKLECVGDVHVEFPKNNKLNELI